MCAFPSCARLPEADKTGSVPDVTGAAKQSRSRTHKRGTCARKRRRKAAWDARAGEAGADAPPSAAHAARTAEGARAAPAVVSAPGGALPPPCGPEQFPPAPRRAASTADSESDSEEILFEGRAGVALVDVGTTPDPVTRDCIFGALRRPDGTGVVFVSGFLDGDALRATGQGVSRVVPSAAEPIFNTQSVAEMRRAELEGAPVDKQRRQALMNPRWESTVVVKASLARLCDLLFHIYGRRYVASEPKVLLTLPGARPHMPHGNAADKNELGNPPRMIGVVMAVEDDSALDTWPGRFCHLTAPGEEQCVVRTSMVERTIVPMGGFLIFRGDMVHRGVENTALSRVLRRVHAYLTLRDSPMASETWRDETCPVKEMP